MRKTIDWNKLWNDFDEWFTSERNSSKVCKTCNHREFIEPEWEDQQNKIQQLVSAQILEIVKKKS